MSSKSFLLVNPNGHSVGHSMQFLVALVGHIASEAAIVELLNRKCLPTLLYGLEACPLKAADLKSLDYIVVGAFMKFLKLSQRRLLLIAWRCSTAHYRPSRLTTENTNFW